MTAMRLKRYPSPSGGFALGKMGVGATMLKQGKTARDYVQSGLVAMWDGIENAGWGVHDPNATTWKDLVGGVETTWLSDADDILSWINNGLRRIGRKGITATLPWANTITKNTAYTLEIVFSDASEASTISLGSYYYFTGVNSQFCVIQNTNYLNLATGSNYNNILNETFGFTPHSFSAVARGVEYPSGTAGRNTFDAYRDGDKIITGRPQSVGASPASLYFFRATRDWPNTRDTTIYRVTIYSRALTASEIAANYTIDKERFNLP